MISERVATWFIGWFYDVGVEQNSINNYAVSLHPMSDSTAKENNTADIKENFVLHVNNTIIVSATVYFLQKFRTESFDKILMIDNTECNIESADVNITFSVKLSQWYTSSINPKNMITNETYIPIFVGKGSEEDLAVTTGGFIEIQPVTKFNSCPYVLFSLNDVSVIMNGANFVLKPYNAIVSYEDIFITNGSVYLCLDVLNHLFESTEMLSTKSTYERTKNASLSILSFICLLLSILCSLPTFCTFLCFKELRNQPGVNNMFLSAFLCTSQTLFLLGYNSAGNVSKLGCSLLGMLVHFSWLVLLVWMNTCTIHTFRVFWKTQVSVASHNVFKTTFVYLIYTSILAAIPVVLNIIISSALKDGTVGYGGEVCYISSSKYAVYLLSAPLCLIVFINIILYIIVVIKIECTRSKIENRSKNKSLILVYVKLSSITGVSWVFGVLIIFTGQLWTEYLFVLFNATQGIFIFLVFVINKKVLGLYRTVLSKHSIKFRLLRIPIAKLTNKTGSYDVSNATSTSRF